jgi:hypothetical protein
MKVIIYKKSNRIYFSYLLTILFLYKKEYHTMIELRDIDHSKNLELTVNRVKSFYTQTDNIFMRIWYYFYIMFFMDTFPSSIGDKVYCFERGNVTDCIKNIITVPELLSVSTWTK